MEAEENSGSSEDSLGSLTAGEVLIRSTSFHMKQTPLPPRTVGGSGSKPAAGVQERIRISVKKLREVPPPFHPGDSTWMEEEDIPPALPANRSGSQKPAAETSRATRESGVCTHARRNSKQPPSGEKEICSPDAAVALTAQAIGEGNKRKATDIFISQYDAGQKEAVRAVFKQRIQNVPVLKEVQVQLLDSVCPDQKDSTRATSSEVDSATTIAAATAAAIASAAPLLKVQSDLEAKVNSVSEILNKLQETDKQLQRVAEQQAASKAQQPERAPCHPRVGELEKQMTLFMEQRIQHLETLQQQQMNIQTHLINSALNSGGFQNVNIPPSQTAAAPAVNTGRSLDNPTSPRRRDLFSANPWNTQASSRQLGNRPGRRQKSPLKAPAPRRYAPVPVSKDAKMSHKMAKREQPIREKENVLRSPDKEAQGGGRFLEQILNSYESPFGQSPSSWKEPPASSKMPWELERERSVAPQAEPFPAFKNPVQDFNPIERTTKKADDVLRDLGQLRRDMQDILQEAKEWKSDMNGFMKQKEQVLLKPPEALQLPKPSILQTAKAPKSIVRDAERILRVVRKNKKVLEENLEAIVRARDGTTLHLFIDALTANRDVLDEIRIRKTVDEWIKAISVEIQDEMARKAREEDRPDKELWKTKQTVSRETKVTREMKLQSWYPQGHTTKRSLPAARPARKPARDALPKMSSVVPNESSLAQIYGRPVYQGHRSTLKKSPYLRINSPPPKLKPPRPKLIESVRGTKVKSARTQTGPSVHGKAASFKKPCPLSAPCRELHYVFSPTKAAPDASVPMEGHLFPMAVPLDGTVIHESALTKRNSDSLASELPKTPIKPKIERAAEGNKEDELSSCQKQMSSISPEPSGLIIGKFHPVTVTTSVPPAPPKPQPDVQKPNIAVVEMKSEKKDPPKLSVQVLPNVDIDSVSSGSPSGNQAPSTPLPTQAAIENTPRDSWRQEEGEEEEELKLPGTDFVQDKGESEEDEIQEFLEPVLEFNRRGEREPPQYNGPPFPPVPPAPQTSADILEEIIEGRETLENKLVSWVEQEVMARVISGMIPALKEAVPNFSSSESEESRTVSSDIVEAAGPAGLQLFVNTGLPVDSEAIRHLVSEAIAETVAVMLGDRESQKPAPAAGPPLSTPLQPSQDPVLETPLPTPQATPPPSPSPPLREPSPVKTPEPSPPATEIDGERQLATATELEAVAVGPVHTPAATPVATPPGVMTPSPPASERIPGREATESHLPPNAWGDAELPLEEEKPSLLSEEGGYDPRAVIMSVAKDEEPEDLVSPRSPRPTQPPELLPQEPPVPSSPAHSLSSGSSTEESSLTVTETETADRPISEGEVLFSYGQVVAMKALAEEGLSLPNPSDSLASTLHDANEMDYDPPSEGQVVLRPHRGYHRDPVLTLFSQLPQVPLASQEDVCHSEDTDYSAGELSEGQRPRLTKAAESLLTGQSVYMDRPSERRLRRAPSPGELGRAAGDALGDVDATRGPMTVAELEHPAAHADQPLMSEPDEAFQKSDHLAVRAVQPRVIQVRARPEIPQQTGLQTDADRTHIEPESYLTSLLSERGNALQLSSLPPPAKMSVTVPSANEEDLQSFSSIHGSSDSSGADTF